jgi:hypothetical protein
MDEGEGIKEEAEKEMEDTFVHDTHSFWGNNCFRCHTRCCISGWVSHHRVSHAHTITKKNHHHAYRVTTVNIVM